MQLVIRSKSSTTKFPLTSGSDWKIGRHPDNDIALDDPKASRRHGRLTTNDGAFFFEDLGTGNGTIISSASIPPNTRIEIKKDDVIEIGEFKLQLVETENTDEEHPEILPKGKTGVLSDLSEKNDNFGYVLGDQPNLIGRLPICQIKIDDIGSSRINTEIVLEDSKYLLRDLGSSNGTFLNEKQIKKEILRPGDVVRVGGHRFKLSFANQDEALQREDAPPTAVSPNDGKSSLSPGCNTISFGLISAIISGVAVFLYMSKSREPVENIPSGAAIISQSKEEVRAPVVVGNPLILDIPVTLEKTGNVQLARQDIIPFPLGQKVKKIHVQNRQRVQKDDALVSFEMTEKLRSARKQAIAGLNQAREDVAKAQSEVAKADAVVENARENLSIIQSTHDRSRRVYQNGNLLQKEWDEVLFKLAEARAGVKLRAEEREQAERSVTQAGEKVVQVQTDLNDVDVMIDDLTVTANSAGVVNRLDLKEGYTVTSINASMELIEYEKEVKVVASASEDDIPLIRDGQEVEIWLPRAPEEIFRGKVSYIPPTAVNRNYAIEIMVPNRDFHFRPGQQVSARFITRTREGAILLPSSALDTSSRTGYHIFTVDPVSRIARLISVKRGQEVTHQNEKYIEVFPVNGDSTISKNDLIVVKGNRAVKHEMRVLIQNLDESTGLPK